MTDIIDLENPTQLNLGERLQPRQAPLTAAKSDLANAILNERSDVSEATSKNLSVFQTRNKDLNAARGAMFGVALGSIIWAVLLWALL
jgi:hypothetical protein